ncbi:Uncharacterised protein [uncultured archaeon]|nr:Uncharacterised protein [uncultured archaeon]
MIHAITKAAHNKFPVIPAARPIRVKIPAPIITLKPYQVASISETLLSRLKLSPPAYFD